MRELIKIGYDDVSHKKPCLIVKDNYSERFCSIVCIFDDFDEAEQNLVRCLNWINEKKEKK